MAWSHKPYILFSVFGQTLLLGQTLMGTEIFEKGHFQPKLIQMIKVGPKWGEFCYVFLQTITFSGFHFFHFQCVLFLVISFQTTLLKIRITNVYISYLGVCQPITLAQLKPLMSKVFKNLRNDKIWSFISSKNTFVDICYHACPLGRSSEKKFPPDFLF